MPSQERAQQRGPKRDRDADESEAYVAEAASTSNTELDADVDAILDEIDDLLEVNAEDFVKSFVQKGGQ